MQHENEKRNEQSNKGAKDQSSSNSTVLYRFRGGAYNSLQLQNARGSLFTLPLMSYLSLGVNVV